MFIPWHLLLGGYLDLYQIVIVIVVGIIVLTIIISIVIWCYCKNRKRKLPPADVIPEVMIN